MYRILRAKWRSRQNRVQNVLWGRDIKVVGNLSPEANSVVENELFIDNSINECQG
jgi:hypothetical protein